MAASIVVPPAAFPDCERMNLEERGEKMTRMTAERLEEIGSEFEPEVGSYMQELIAEIRAAWAERDALCMDRQHDYQEAVEDALRTCLLPVERISFCHVCNEENKMIVQEIKNAVRKIRAFAELKKEKSCTESPV